MSRTTARAICSTTRVFRARCASLLWLNVRPPARSAWVTRGAGMLDHGNQSKQQAGQHRERQREQQGRRIDCDVLDAREKIGALWTAGAAERHTPGTARRLRPAARGERSPSAEFAARRPQLAPMAARTASSCWRPSALTRSRLATFAQAISSTTPMLPISTQRTLPRLPTTSCLSGRTLGRILASSNSLTLKPGGGGNLVFTMGIMRATSAFAWARVTPVSAWRCRDS